MDGVLFLGETLIGPVFEQFIFLAETTKDAGAGGSDGHSTALNPYLMLLIAAVLVALNGFFVAAEFALVKIRVSQVDKLVADKKVFAKPAKWLTQRLDHSLSCCQLGITMASLALGYVGEPAFAHLIEPYFHYIGVTSEFWVRFWGFALSFSVVTSLHLVIGEQAPKIFAIRKPEDMVRWCAPLMVVFYYMLFPFMYVLQWATDLILGMLGLGGGSGHDSPHTEEEIRALLREAHIHGNLTDSEDRLLHNIFEFDDLVCRLVMVPRGEVQILDANLPFPEQLKIAKTTKHTRYPLCDGSLDSLLGVVHMKDLLGIDEATTDFDLRDVMREPVKVPENLPISRVLKRIQNTHQLLTFVVDEYGTIIGICTLENVLEKIIGPVDDEFDAVDEPSIRRLGKGQFMILGSTPISEVEKAVGLNLDDLDVDTVAGVLMTRLGKMPEVADKVEFDGCSAEILEVKNDHAERIRFTLDNAGASENPPTKPTKPH
ncbi:MAG: hemolysin family protein [Mariniblastus sp.]